MRVKRTPRIRTRSPGVRPRRCLPLLRGSQRTATNDYFPLLVRALSIADKGPRSIESWLAALEPRHRRPLSVSEMFGIYSV